MTGEQDEHEDERGRAQEDERAEHSKVKGGAQLDDPYTKVNANEAEPFLLKETN